MDQDWTGSLTLTLSRDGRGDISLQALLKYQNVLSDRVSFQQTLLPRICEVKEGQADEKSSLRLSSHH